MVRQIREVMAWPSDTRSRSAAILRSGWRVGRRARFRYPSIRSLRAPWPPFPTHRLRPGVGDEIVPTL